MSNLIEVKVPDIGDFKDVPVIDILVKPGDVVKAEDPLVSLESDKATMDVPAPTGGVIKEIKVKLGDKLSEGSLLMTLEAEAGGATPAPSSPSGGASPATSPAPSAAPAAGKSGGQAIEVKVPDIGDFKDVPVIEIMVRPGDQVKGEDPLVTLESDKATMEVPSPGPGTIREVKVKIGDKVSEGTLLLTLESAEGPKSSAGPNAAPQPATAQPQASPAKAATGDAPPAAPTPTAPAQAVDESGFRKAHASPGVRAFARELGVDLTLVKGKGPKERILKEDVQNFVKNVMTGAAATGSAPAASAPAGGGLNLLPWPKVDFAKFGEVEVKPLSRIKKLSGANLARNWVMIPHVTQHDEADITELESLRVQINKEVEKSGVKITMLAFLIKASVAALKKYPDFNASLDGENLVLKRYVHVGFAADTPNGLVVPVIRDADKKGVLDIAKDMAALSAKAREGKLGPAEMQGGCFSISSLGGIGGTYFTPIINAPEVAILGVSKSYTKPVWDGKTFAPRLTLPLSLSYDHRVIDGASAARFTSYIAQLVADMRRVIL